MLIYLKITHNTHDLLKLEYWNRKIAGVFLLIGAASLVIALTDPSLMGPSFDLRTGGAIAAACFLAAWWAAPLVRLRFLRDASEVELSDIRPLYTKRRTIPFRQLKGAGTAQTQIRSRVKTCLGLVTTDGDFIPIERTFTNAQKTELVDAINTWLSAAQMSPPTLDDR